LSEWLYRVTKWWLALVASIIFVLFVVIIFPEHAGTGGSASGKQAAIFSPDLSLWYSPGDLYKMAGALGNEGRRLYVWKHFTFDLAWPVVYLFFLVTSTTWLLKTVLKQKGDNRERRLRRLNLLPLVAVSFDLLENVSTSLVVSHYPRRLPILARMAPFATLSKWIVVSLSVLVLAASMVIAIVRVFHRKEA